MSQFSRHSVLYVSMFYAVFITNSFQWNRMVQYISLEHPQVIYENTKHVHIFNITARRISRRDPIYNIQYHAHYFDDLDNNMTIFLDIYEFLSNEYRPTFVKWPLKLCDFFSLTKKNMYHARNIAETLIPYEVKFKKDNCFGEKGIYLLANFTMPTANVPQYFPFEKGRIYINQSYAGKVIAAGFIDLEIRLIPKINKN